MRVVILSSLVMCWTSAGLLAGEAAPKRQPILETWDAAYIGTGRAGHVRTLFEEVHQDGTKFFAATVSMRLNVKRFDEVISLGMDTGTVENAQGKVVGTFMRQMLGKNKKIEIVGTVRDGKLHLVQDGGNELPPAPWNEKVVGLYRQFLLFQERQVKPGDAFTFMSYEPSIHQTLVQEVSVKNYEDPELPGANPKKKLLRVEIKPRPVEKVQLPTQVLWLQPDRTQVRVQTKIDGIGLLTLLRTTKEFALAPGDPAVLTDIGLGQLVKIKQRMLRPADTKKVIYRMTLRDDPDPLSAFAKYSRQDIRNLKGKTFDLEVTLKEGEISKETPGPEFTQSSYFINSNDPLVKELAQKAVGEEADPWKKAVRIEKWVKENMKFGSHEVMATADHAARTLEGDCSEAAMLTAAMCRAQNIPSRPAVGLIYAEVNGPTLSFHMWTEVWTEGRWKALDATLGHGRVAADHIKIADHSWNDVRSMTPVFPVLRVLGKLTVDIVHEEY